MGSFLRSGKNLIKSCCFFNLLWIADWVLYLPQLCSLLLPTWLRCSTLLLPHLQTWEARRGTDADQLSLCVQCQVWRFFTYQFVHVGLEHIAFNILMQLVVGLPLEMAEPGWKGTGRCSASGNFQIWCRVLFVYTSGVLLGSLGGTLPNPHFS